MYIVHMNPLLILYNNMVKIPTGGDRLGSYLHIWPRSLSWDYSTKNNILS